MMSRSQPCRVRTLGLLASPVQMSSLPLSSVASTEIITWGLLNWKSVTVPFTVVNFDVSNADVPWCAKMGAATMRRTTIPANATHHQFFIPNPYRGSRCDRAAAHRLLAAVIPLEPLEGTRPFSIQSLYHCAPWHVKGAPLVWFRSSQGRFAAWNSAA